MKLFKVVRIDDIDGKEKDVVDTVRFSYEGKSYEIDLGEENRERFDKMMNTFIAKARPRGGVRKPPRSHTKQQDVRAWARKRGMDIGTRGRIPTHVMDEYRKARKKSA